LSGKHNDVELDAAHLSDHIRKSTPTFRMTQTGRSSCRHW